LFNDVNIVRGRGHKKTKQKETALTKIVAVRIDDSLYNWLVKAKNELLLDDFSSTIRTLLRIMQFLTETGQIKTPTQDLKEQFEDFLQRVNNQRFDDTPP
jgi:adenylate kinase family enzyme